MTPSCALNFSFSALFLVSSVFASLDLDQTPLFLASTQPTFKQGAKVQLKRIVLKSKTGDSIHPHASSVSKKLGIATVDVDHDSDVSSTLENLMQHAEYAVKDSLVWAAAVPTGDAQPPNDPDFRFQWGLTRIKAPDAWKALQEAVGSKARDVVTVCVADSGVDATHPDLQGNLNSEIGFNAIEKNSDVNDGLKHGTHVAGIVSAIKDNDLAVAGVGTDGTKVLTCKFLNDEGYGYASDAVACIDYCLENGADIITNSWSGGQDNPALRDAMQNAFEQDVLLVMAAGNTATNLDEESIFPANYASEFSNILVVASTDYKDRLSNFSNYGESVVHLGAPGEWILSIIPNNDTAYYSGTSMAAPMVAGTAAMVQAAAGGKLKAEEIKKILLDSTEPLPSLSGKVATGGILRADKAVEAAVQLAQQPTAASRKFLLRKAL